MPLFRCSKCGCVENTALGWYWARTLKSTPEQWQKPLCSEHAPKFIDGKFSDQEEGVWHGKFPQESATGWWVDQSMLIWHPSDMLGAPHAYGPHIGKYAEDGTIIPMTEEEAQKHKTLTEEKAVKDRAMRAKVMAENAASARNAGRPWVSLSNKKSRQKKAKKA